MAIITRNNWKGYFRAEDFRGQWMKSESGGWRVPEQVRCNLFQQLTGEGLGRSLN